MISALNGFAIAWHAPEQNFISCHFLEIHHSQGPCDVPFVALSQTCRATSELGATFMLVMEIQLAKQPVQKSMKRINAYKLG